MNRNFWFLLTILFFETGLNGQHFLDVDNHADESFYAIDYDTLNNQYHFYFFSSPLGGSLHDSTTSLYCITTNAELEAIDTTEIYLPNLGEQHFQSIQKDEAFKHKFVLRTGDFFKLGNSYEYWFYNHYSNYHLCEIVHDSLKVIKTLLPDSTYAARYYGTIQIDGKPAFLLRYAESSSDTALDFVAKKYDVITNTLFLSKSLSFNYTLNKPYLSGNFHFMPHSRPVKLQSGGWGSILSGLNTGFLHLAHLNSNFDSILDSQIIQSEFNYLQENCWQLGNKLYAYETGDSIDVNSPILDGSYLPAVYEYDLSLDSITNIFYFKPPGFEEENVIEAGYTSHFDGEHFILGAVKKRIDRDFHYDELILGVFDTNFVLKNYVSFKDTSAFNMDGGFTHVINDPANKDSYIYYGSIGGGSYRPTGNGFDIFWGRISANPIGIDEMPFAIKKKELWMYPNPAIEGKFTLKSTAEEFSLYNITIYDLMGREVFKEEIKSKVSFIETDLTSGTYFLKSDTGDILKFLVP